MEENKVLLSVKDLEVKFRVRGRILTAIRSVSLDIMENESIAIVGESGSGKSVFTKTFAGMLDSNGFISNGDIIFADDELAATRVELNSSVRKQINEIASRLDRYSHVEAGAEAWKHMEQLKQENADRSKLDPETEEKLDAELTDLVFNRTEVFNHKQTLDPKNQKTELKKASAELDRLESQILQKQEEKKKLIAAAAEKAKNDTEYQHQFQTRMTELKQQYAKQIAATAVSEETHARNVKLAKEITLSVNRYSLKKRITCRENLLKALKAGMVRGEDLTDNDTLNRIFDTATFRVRLDWEDETTLYGTCTVNLAKVTDASDWSRVRGQRIATVFQDPMTSLNPIITIGKQITSIIIKHQHCSEIEARARALEMMERVGIPEVQKRFDDYPFQYSGGMRQRIVIAIALSCQPKILICDEPTTALDVTIQAQILQLLKDLQRELGFTIVFITHDLGVVANIADRVAVMYAGQIVEVGKVDEVFYDPRHPYTWALLSALPQLAEKNSKLYSITGTPPSLYNKIVGDPFAPRNPYCMKIDTLKEPPMFPVTETHFAKTWLLDPRSPEIKKPELIEDIHTKLINAFNI